MKSAILMFSLFCNLLPSQHPGICARRWQLSRRQAPSNRFSQSLIDLPIDQLQYDLSHCLAIHQVFDGGRQTMDDFGQVN
jgi:hypothetical protein